MWSWSDIRARLNRLFTPQPKAAAASAPHGPTPRRSFWRAAKWPGIAFASLIAVCVLVLAFIDWNAMRGPVSRYLSHRLNREVNIAGDLNVKLFSWTPRAEVHGLTIAQPDWVNGRREFADIGQLIVALDLKQLLRFHFVLAELDIDRSAVDLLRDTDGRQNWEFGDAKDSSPTHIPPIRHFRIRDGRLNITDAKRKLTFAGKVTSEEGSEGTERIFRLDGDGRLNQQPFELEVRGDPLLNIEPDKPYGFSGTVRAGDTRIEGKGSLDRPFDLAAFNFTATFAGPDLADLYYLTGLAFPNTPPYRLNGKLTRSGEVWKFAGISGKVGNSDLKGSLSVDTEPERPMLTADLASKSLDFDDLGTIIGAHPATQGGETASPAQKQMAVRVQATAVPRVLPDTPLRVERLRQMDAKVHYKADKVVSEDFPLRAAELELTLKNGVLRLDPVTFGFAQGKMTGNIQIDARKSVPATDIDVRLTGLSLAQFLPASGGEPAVEGTAVARAKLHGTGDSIRKAAGSADGTMTLVMPHGAVRKSMAELLGINVASALGLILSGDETQTDVRCAVAHFAAKDGTARLQQFVFDTGVVMASGEGSIDLKNEKLDLKINGHPKKPELVRLRAPITVTGYLGAPSVGVDAGKAVAQGGLAAGLGLLLSPLAAILPFVDPGLADDADCATLVREAREKGAPATPATSAR